MNRKLISLAVAAALVAPAAAMADATLYGKLNVSLDYADVKNAYSLPKYAIENGQIVETAKGEDFSGWGMSSNGYIPGEGRASRLGVKGSEDLGGGLKAIYQIELGINANDTNDNVLSNSDSITYRNTFVGLAGGWGTALMGRHDTPMKISTSKLDLFADTMADYNGTVGFRDLRADNAVAYISPSWGGFTFAGAVIPAGGATGGGQGLNPEEDSIAGAYSLAGIYSNGPFYASAAYESLGNQHFNSGATAVAGDNCPVETPAADVRDPTDPYTSTCAYQDSDANAWRIGLGLLDWNGFTLTAVYEDQDQFFSDYSFGYTDPLNPGNSFSVPTRGPTEAQLWQVQAGYRFGNTMIKAMYGQGEYEGDLTIGKTVTTFPGGAVAVAANERTADFDTSTWAVGVDYDFSKRTKAYALYTSVENDLENFVKSSEWDGFSLGMMHSF